MINKPPIPPPTHDDLRIFQGLQRAFVEKKAYVKIDFKRLNKTGSPFFNPWENGIPVLIILAVSFSLMFMHNLVVGMMSLLALSLLYAFFMPVFLEPIMLNRVLRRIVPRIEKFLIAWRYGGFSIILAADGHFSCQAPSGDWRTFTQTYFADLIPPDFSDASSQKSKKHG